MFELTIYELIYGFAGGAAIGIDFGNTNSSVGVYRNNRVENIPDDQGQKTTPTCVAFSAEGEALFGHTAKDQSTTNPERTISNFKRIIGRKFNDPVVQKYIESTSCKIIEKDSKPHVQISVGQSEKVFVIEEIAAMFLSHLKKRAEAHLGEVVEKAVITVSSYFNNAQRQSIKDIGEIAGFNQIDLINEPIAAAISYRLDHNDEKKNTLAIDLGGGSLDVSLLQIENGDYKVIATRGDTNFGGEDFNQRLIDHFIESYKDKTGKDIRQNAQAMEKLRREIERSKCELSFKDPVIMEIKPFLDGHDFSETLTRQEFKNLNKDLFEKFENAIENVLKDSKIERRDIDDVLFTGGSSRIPKTHELITACIGKSPLDNVNPDEQVASGATIQAGVLSGEKDKNDIQLWDVNPLSLGTSVVGDFMSVIVPRNTTIPTRKTGKYTTTFDNQSAVLIDVYEGEDELIENNYSLGEFTLTGILPAPKCIPVIDVTFEIDANSILHVTAIDRETKNQNNIQINYDQSRLNPEEIDRLIQNATSDD